MGHQSTCIAVLDNNTSSSKRLIESSVKMLTKQFESIGSLIDTPLMEEPSSIFIDTEHIGKDAISENLHRIKEKWPMAPIIAMTLERNIDNIVELVRYGFDEFLLKPLSADELTIRMQVKKQLLGKAKERSVTAGDISVDPSSRSVKNIINGKVKYLSPIEINLLSILLGSKEESISRENVKRSCWGSTSVSDNALNRKLFEVRRALSEIGSNFTIKTLYGSGYAIQRKNPGEE